MTRFGQGSGNPKDGEVQGRVKELAEKAAAKNEITVERVITEDRESQSIRITTAVVGIYVGIYKTAKQESRAEKGMARFVRFPPAPPI